MRIDDIQTGQEYWLTQNSPYVFTKDIGEDSTIFYNYVLTNVKVVATGLNIKIHNKYHFNIEIEIAGYLNPYKIYTNSFYLQEIKGLGFDDKTPTDNNMHIISIDWARDNNSNEENLDCVEIHNGKADFSKIKNEKIFKKRLELARKSEFTLGEETNKDLIIMKADLALENKNLEEFQKWSNELRKLKER